MRKLTLARGAAIGVAAIASLALAWQVPVQAAFYGLPKLLKQDMERISVGTPSLAPMAHAVFCVKYRDDCEVKRMAFRPRPVTLTEQRWNEMRTVNTSVNRAIAPEANLRGVAFEQWLVSPRSGDCNDYAVTKRHELLALGWPSRSLLLAEVIMPSGEHHLVVLVRLKEGDFVLDNMNANIRPWSRTQYRWVRMQSPMNPKYWSTVRPIAV
jgi:predicted transglutaminase-like cysteine proteinase